MVVTAFKRAAAPKRGEPGVVGAAIPPVDYYDIVARAVAALKENTVEARHNVYERAREVVERRLRAMRPPPSKPLVEFEQLALDLAIKRVEAEAAERPAPPQPGAKPAAAVVQDNAPGASPARLHVRTVRNQTLRFIAVAAVLAGVGGGTWLLAGPPDLAAALNRAPLLSPLRSDEPPAAPLAANDAPTPADAPAAEPAPAETEAAAADTAAPATSAPAVEAPTVAAADAASACANAATPSERVTCTDSELSSAGALSEPAPADQKLPFWIAAYNSITDAAGAQGSNAAVPSSSVATAPQAAPAAGRRELYERAMASARRGDIAKAMREFADVIRADPLMADAFVGRGQLYFKNGEQDRAMTDFDEAIRLDHGNAMAYRSRGMALLYRGDEERALADLTRAIQLGEGAPEHMPPLDLFYTRRSRAALYEKKQMYDRELVDLSAMIDAYWKNPLLVDALKANYQESGTSGLLASIYRLRAGVFAKRANYEGAIADLSFALQLDAARGYPALIERARIQETLGRREAAVADFQRALDLNPQSQEARSALARLRGQRS